MRQRQVGFIIHLYHLFLTKVFPHSCCPPKSVLSRTLFT